ncbi:hypothetical protein KGF56_004635 [Candida oxycetoniae]|uniref:Uncharacterized protein n=1 Tax=Candida oxycetoniae TaxID=497107 RepID=A0AAI9WW38_9ASCO|nr:uncharacterized protein KGF56_004635 [Candida oxycetoniae]KAI3402543.2 hypothetical protein KGF56_004635 [Candida oxycetoniae]
MVTLPSIGLDIVESNDAIVSGIPLPPATPHFQEGKIPSTSPIPQNSYHQTHITNHYKFIQTAPIAYTSPATVQVLPLTSSSFDIPTPTQSEPLTTPISPSPQDLSSLLSPHEPPHEVDLYFPQRQQKLRQQMSRNTGAFFSGNAGGGCSSDVFTEYVENRFARFRPTESQHNNDVVMNNLHPFQRDDYGVEQKSIFENITTWFKKKPIVATDLETQSQSPPTTDKSASCTAGFLQRGEEMGNTAEPVYTPRGIPINEYPLNFIKQQDNSNLGEENERRTAIINSFDEEVRDLVDGVDNFLTSCFDGVWTFTSGLCSTCLDPFDE